METLRYGIVGVRVRLAVPSARARKRARRRGRGHHVAHAAARARGVGRAHAGSATRACSTACARWRPRSTWSRSSTRTSARVDVMEEIAAAVARRRAVARPDLREAARAQPGRGAPGDRARRRDRRADRVLREPDPHEDAAAGAGAARRARPRRWGRSRSCAPPRSTAARTARGSGTRPQQGGGVLSDMGCHSIAVGPLPPHAGRPVDAVPRADSRCRRT